MLDSNSTDDSTKKNAGNQVRLVEAVMAHFEAQGAATFLMPVVGSRPPLYVALGTLSQVASAVAGQARLAED